jgi:pSer/pThr/pTyr-binding forkhead associated (FHA) protein
LSIVLSVTERGQRAECKSYAQTELTIGRVKDNDVVLPRGNVSKRHARVVLRDGKAILVDLKSTNGTYVNGQRINAPQVLKASDNVVIGDFTLRVGEPDELSGDDEVPAEKLDWVITVDGPDGRQQFALLDDVTMGRSRSCDIHIAHPNVGRRQLRILPFSRYVAITDLGTALGTWVNGERLTGSTRLTSSDDVVEFAAHRMWVHRPGEEPPTELGRKGRKRGPGFMVLTQGVLGPEIVNVEDGEEVVAGSTPQCRIQLPGGDLPAEMLRFFADGEQLWVTEIEASPMGVMLGDRRLVTGDATAIAPGDILRLPAGISLSIQSARPVAPPAPRREVTIPRMRVPRPRPPSLGSGGQRGRGPSE